jgi:hypothetical protein
MQADRLDAIDAFDRASRRSDSAESSTDAMQQLDDREVEAELRISSTDIMKRMGITVDAYRAPLEERMIDSGAGIDAGSIEHGGLLLTGAGNGVVSPARSSVFGMDVDSPVGKQSKFQVMEDTYNPPWDGIATQAPALDESW